MKYKVLYDTTIATKIYKKDEVLEFDDKTDKNFIKRLQTIKAIVEIPSNDEVKQPDDDEVKQPDDDEAKQPKKATTKK